jgi:LysR family glycine cleavage system transcriptional activator
LPLLPHDAWPRWFREAGADIPGLRFYADDYPTHELDASAAIEGAGVALLSPLFFGPLLRDGKLLQPFPHVIRGPAAHHILLQPGEARPVVLRFRDWLQDEARPPAGRRNAPPAGRRNAPPGGRPYASGLSM